jgi:hypothetical protein
MRSSISTLRPKRKGNIEIRLPRNLLRLLPNLRAPLLRCLDNRRSASSRQNASSRLSLRQRLNVLVLSWRIGLVCGSMTKKKMPCTSSAENKAPKL